MTAKATKKKATKKKVGKKKTSASRAANAQPAMKWSLNNMACVALWGALLTLAQNDKTFARSAAVAIGSFPIWVPGEATPLRRERARMLATQIDNVFRGMNGARYEDGSNKAKALRAMTPILVDDERTLVDLADAVDDAYRFQGETHA